MPAKDVSVVLAHGAWADGSSWARVITALKAEVMGVSATPLPLTSLADDVAALNRSLERTEGPIVLAAHAYAGAVIALARPRRVKALVYVTALAPDEGEKITDVFYRSPPHPQAPNLTPDSDGLIWLPEQAFATAFAQNASAEDRAVLACCAAADFAELHQRSGRATALETRSELVFDCRRRSDDLAANSALYGGANEREDQDARRRSHTKRYCSDCGGRHH
jgi:pimeloyl-ACP methyl ester carboxylesterase